MTETVTPFETITGQLADVQAQGDQIIAANKGALPFGAELLTNTPHETAQNLGALACIMSKGTQVDDSTGHQDTINPKYEGISGISLEEITSLN